MQCLTAVCNQCQTGDSPYQKGGAEQYTDRSTKPFDSALWEIEHVVVWEVRSLSVLFDLPCQQIVSLVRNHLL